MSRAAQRVGTRVRTRCASTAPAAPRSETKRPPAVAAKRFSQLDVDALVVRWLEVQNRGDFAGYEALYASDLRGTKRVGERATSMGDALRIVEEEMLDSELAASGVRLTESFLPVVVLDGKPHAMIRPVADASWGQGPFSTLQLTEGVERVYRRAADPKLTPDTATWLGRSLRVYGRVEGGCRAKVVDLQLYAAAMGSFNTEEEMADADEQARGKAAFARQIPSLIGRLDGCEGLFALPAEHPPPAIYQSEPVDPALAERALISARARPYYLDKQREWLREMEGDPTIYDQSLHGIQRGALGFIEWAPYYLGACGC